MSGINHEWNGTILTVTSDSGTSAADLKGPKGDTGPRGPQGPAGVIYNASGQLLIDLAPYTTFDDVNMLLDNVQVDLSAYPTRVEADNTYASKSYVALEVAKAQLEGAGVDTSGFATKEDLANVEVDIDNKTLVKDGDGRIRTVIGGYANNGGGVNYSLKDIYYTSYGGWNGWQTTILGNIGKPWVAGCLYQVQMTFADGDTISFEAEFELVPDKWNPNKQALDLVQSYEEVLFDTQNHISCLYVEENGNFYYTPKAADVNENFNELQDKWICTAVTIYADGYVPIDGNYIPVDGTSIYLNSEGKLACTLQIGEGGDVNLSNFYTKAEIDALLAEIKASGGNIPSSEEVNY